MSILLAILSKIVQALACLLLVDFVTGVFHWLEDAYAKPEWPILGKLVAEPNIRHHLEPRYFIRLTWLESAMVPLMLVALLLGGAWLAGVLTWHVWFIALIGANANEIHKLAHRSKKENWRWVTALQGIGLLQSPRHHGNHHRNAKDSHYCVITNYLNPALEAVRFWQRIELALHAACGLTRRPDPSVR